VPGNVLPSIDVLAVMSGEEISHGDGINSGMIDRRSVTVTGLPLRRHARSCWEEFKLLGVLGLQVIDARPRRHFLLKVCYYVTCIRILFTDVP
jgi:hypothetical protein